MSAYPPQQPWTEREQAELLVNILQSHRADYNSFLLEIVIRETKGAFRWSDIALPKGRTMHACQIMVEEMCRADRADRGPSRGTDTKINASHSPYIPIAPAQPGLLRSFSDQVPSQNVQRQLAPQTGARIGVSMEISSPQVTNGGSPLFSLRTTSTERNVGGEMVGKKRGRPTKVEQEERKKRVEAGEEIMPKKRNPKRARPSLLPGQTEMREKDAVVPLLDTPTMRAKQVDDIVSTSTSAPTTKDNSLLENRSAQQRTPERNLEDTSQIVASPSDRLLARGSTGSTRRPPPRDDEGERSHSEKEFPT